MKAVVCEQTGEQGYVVYRDHPEPSVGPGWLIVDGHAMSLNFPDVLQISGLYQSRPEVPFVLGMEYAGVVREVGPDVQEFKVGDRVAGMTQGAFAEQIVAAEVSCYALPDDVSFEAGASLNLAGGTALYGLRERGGLQAGENLVVFGASGGTGSYAVQLGALMGANVIAVCSTPEKAVVARDYGAHHTIDLSNDDLTERLKELTGKHGIDVLYDPVGGDVFDATHRRMAWKGRILTIGYASGRIPKLDINWSLIKGYSLIGVHWAACIQKEVPLARKVVADVFDLCAQGKLRPAIHSEYKLQDIESALDLMRTRGVTGKVVVRP